MRYIPQLRLAVALQGALPLLQEAQLKLLICLFKAPKNVFMRQKEKRGGEEEGRPTRAPHHTSRRCFCPWRWRCRLIRAS